ncbi:MAG: 5,10-methylenetetrahydrofolate reductase [Myxococcota bacterium]|jgi:5,10-methylenetetrahydrofolate reductase
MQPPEPGRSRSPGPVRVSDASMTTLLEQLQSPEPMISVELRPPRADLASVDCIDTWMAMHGTVRRLSSRKVPLFITDGAVGTEEEENLHHLVNNLDEALSRQLLCPFLTTKHSLEYCQWFAARAVEAGCSALTVLGGDRNVGAPRCVPHGYVLRQKIRESFPDLALGGWANPHRSPERQVQYLADPSFYADFYLTQLVSHHHIGAVDAFLGELDRKGVTIPGVWGVFFYRSANPRTLARLSEFIEVPIDGLKADFASGLKPAEVCAKTIRALMDRGITNIYVSNLHPERAPRQLKAIMRAVERGV